ncbi:MAG: hypothetical protein U1A27_04500 [Phycisphaerae bacterium]
MPSTVDLGAIQNVVSTLCHDLPGELLVIPFVGIMASLIAQTICTIATSMLDAAVMVFGA